MPLRLVPEIFDAIDVISFVCKEFRVVDPKVLKVRNIQYIVASPAVRIDDAIRYDFTLDDGK